MSKISYILITKDRLSSAYECLSSIFSLPKHDMEFIVCCPESSISSELDQFLIKQHNIKIVIDTEQSGGTWAINRAYQEATGKYVSLVINDVVYPPNFLSIVDYLNNDFKEKKFKIVNIMWDGGPGLPIHNHPDEKEGFIWEAHLWTPVDISLTPYPVIPLPFMELETFHDKLGGKLIHPDFKNHYGDHWLGFFVSKNETFKPFNWVCPYIKYKSSQYRGSSNCGNDEYDKAVLRRLTDNFHKNPTQYIV